MTFNFNHHNTNKRDSRSSYSFSPSTKNNYLIIDFNQMLYVTLYAMKKNEKEDNVLEDYRDPESGRIFKRIKLEAFNNQFKNFFWNTIIGIVSRFDGVKQVILCHDNKSWRKDVFPYYKAKRALSKGLDNFDWGYFFDLANDFQTNEVEKFGPFIPLNVRKCEGDDIIGVIATGLAQEYPNSTIFIHSSDKDFVQLLKYPNIKLFSPLKRKFIKSSNPKNDLLELILLGDRCDGIPNVLNKDDAFINPDTDKLTGKVKRMKPLGEVAVRKAIIENKIYDKIIKSPEIQKNFDRNKLLIDLEMIPIDVKRKILEEYKKQLELFKQKSPATLQRYFINNGLQQVAQSFPKILHLF